MRGREARQTWLPNREFGNRVESEGSIGIICMMMTCDSVYLFIIILPDRIVLNQTKLNLLVAKQTGSETMREKGS